MAIMHTRRRPFGCRGLLLLLLTPLASSAQAPQAHSAPQKPPESSASSTVQSDDDPTDDLESCRVHRVTSLPGSHQFASDYIETLASDPDPAANDTDVIWALTADLSNALRPWEQALYISKSTNGGATWAQVARLDSRYFDAKIGEGIRNGLSVAPGGSYFIVTTQRGAFQITPQPASQPLVKVITGPRVPDSPPKLPIAKKPGDPVRANVVQMTSDGNHLILGYGYFDRDPQMFTYHREKDGSWVQDGPLPPIPTEMDLLSMQFDEVKRADPRFLYVGTGDQVYLLNLKSMRWSRVDGVGPDSAIHGMSVVGGLHLAACWGIYYPTGPGMVRRVTDAHFLIHPTSDEAGSNLRAYSIDVDPTRPNREVVTSLTGVYVTQDRGETWRRINDLPQEEFRTAHISSDGTILVSGIAGTFLINPFSDACSPRLKFRKK
jgi:hypothetical protein